MTPEPARPQQAKKAAPAQIVDCLGRDVPRRCCRRFPPRQHGHQPLGARQELRAGGSNVGRAGWRVGRQFWHIGWTLLTSDQRALQDEQMRLALLPTGSDGVSVTYCLVPSLRDLHHLRAVPLRTRLDMWWHLFRRNAISPAAYLLELPDRIQTLPRYLLLRSPEGSSISYTLGRDCYIGFCARRLYPFEGLLCDVSARRNACLDDFGALWEESPALPIQWEITASATTATISQNKANNIQPTGLRSDDCIGNCRKCSGDFSRPRDPPVWP